MPQDCLRSLRIRLKCLPWRMAAATGLYRGDGPPVRFVIENADWSVRWDGEQICNTVDEIARGCVSVTNQPQRLANRLVHFGSQYMWLAWGQHMSATNRYIVSFFHGKREDGPETSRHIDEFLKSVPRLARIVTGASLIERRLLDWGVPREKVVRIPIGVDNDLFQPPSPAQKARVRGRLGIPDDALVIGSFQKDGIGWGEGKEPKMIKGPDLLVDAIERLRVEFPVVVLLTGPARGYVKQRLESLGVPYVHRYVKHHTELVECYHALDLYCVSSREEGGPKGLMESMASGVPVVATPVGMAPDLILDGITGWITTGFSGEELAHKARAIFALSDSDLHQVRLRARQAVSVADWSVVGRDHWSKVYQPLLH